MNKTHLIALTGLLFAAASTAQTVHYPDDVHANPPEFGFPFYTPGAGATNESVRVQFLCPDNFLQNEGLQAGYVTSIGLSIGGAATYSTFVLRAGATDVNSLGLDWDVNLPDQRVQADLSGQVITGGGTPANPVCEWVDFELAYPFYYQPGDQLVIDLTTHIAVPGEMCATTSGGGVVQRRYNFSYVPGALATNTSQGGLKMRFDFAPLGLLPFGDGCVASNGQTPELGSIGAPQIGQPIAITADQVIPSNLGVFVWGFSREAHNGAPLPVDLGAGCSLLVGTDILDPVVSDAAGHAATAILFPNDPNLKGSVLFTQFAQLDPGAAALVPFTVSGGGILSVF